MLGRIVTFRDGSVGRVVHVSLEEYRGAGFNTVEMRPVPIVQLPNGTRRPLVGRDVASVCEATA